MWLRILLLFCLISSPAHAGWINKQGTPLPETEDRKSNGNFGAQLIFVNDEQTLFKRWATPSETVELDTVETIQINQPINAFVIFSGCKASVSGNCNVSMRLRVIQPDGKIYSVTPSMEVWRDKPAPPGHTLELSVHYLKVVVEPHEQRGRYTVQAQVRDDNSDTVLSLNKTFTVSDLPPKEKHNNTVKRDAPKAARPLP